LISSPRTWALEVLAASRDRYRRDDAYQLAPIQSGHIDEMEWLVTRQSVPSLESYDLAHFEFIMRAATRIQQPHPALATSATQGERGVGHGAGSLRRAPGVGAGGCVVTLVGQAGSRCPIHPQLSTGFPASPGYPHLVDNRAPDRYS